MPVTKFDVKQTDEIVEIKVDRLLPNLNGIVKFGWHVVDGDPKHPLDYFYERQRGHAIFEDQDAQCLIKFKLLQVFENF